GHSTSPLFPYTTLFRSRSAAGSAVTSSPSKRIVPSLGLNAPAIRLNKVDLPAPFGPIRPTISPRPTEIETSEFAVRPEKRCVMRSEEHTSELQSQSNLV